MAKSVAAAIAKDGRLAPTATDYMLIVRGLARAIWRALPMIDMITEQGQLAKASRPTGICPPPSSDSNDAADTALSSVVLAQLGEGCLILISHLNRELDAAKRGFQKLDQENWGAFAAKELLSEIRYQIGDTISILKVLAYTTWLLKFECLVLNTLLPVFGEPQVKISQSFSVREGDLRVEGTLRAIQESLRPINDPTLEPPTWDKDSVTGMLSKSLAKAWSEGLKGKTAERITIIQSLVEAALGPHLQPLIFGAKITAQCLKNYCGVCPTHEIQQCLENAFDGRMQLIGVLHHVLALYEPYNALAAALKPESAKMLRFLQESKDGLAYDTVRECSAEYTELNKDFEDAITARMVCFDALYTASSPAQTYVGGRAASDKKPFLEERMVEKSRKDDSVKNISFDLDYYTSSCPRVEPVGRKDTVFIEV
ncbi:hypothetical protein DFH07DRAFT_775604 [Mycena maculata]|uniref:Uncharacterized protein n=1 Tax=Mycena maculata TaxID=230809 RepID=A0AAD7IR57_9AGAR|nr:hypothetical protein DFH07DRAFT_775604 [Mycena maculata]